MKMGNAIDSNGEFLTKIFDLSSDSHDLRGKTEEPDELSIKKVKLLSRAFLISFRSVLCKTCSYGNSQALFSLNKSQHWNEALKILNWLEICHMWPHG